MCTHLEKVTVWVPGHVRQGGINKQHDEEHIRLEIDSFGHGTCDQSRGNDSEL